MLTLRTALILPPKSGNQRHDSYFEGRAGSVSVVTRHTTMSSIPLRFSTFVNSCVVMMGVRATFAEIQRLNFESARAYSWHERDAAPSETQGKYPEHGRDDGAPSR